MGLPGNQHRAHWGHRLSHEELQQQAVMAGEVNKTHCTPLLELLGVCHRLGPISFFALKAAYTKGTRLYKDPTGVSLDEWPLQVPVATFLQKLEPENGILKTGQRRANLWSVPKACWALETGKPDESTNPMNSGHSASTQSPQHMLASPVVGAPWPAGGWKMLNVGITHSTSTWWGTGLPEGIHQKQPSSWQCLSGTLCSWGHGWSVSQLHLPALPMRMGTWG